MSELKSQYTYYEDWKAAFDYQKKENIDKMLDGKDYSRIDIHFELSVIDANNATNNKNIKINLLDLFSSIFHLSKQYNDKNINNDNDTTSNKLKNDEYVIRYSEISPQLDPLITAAISLSKI